MGGKFLLKRFGQVGHLFAFEASLFKDPMAQLFHAVGWNIAKLPFFEGLV